MVQANQLHKRIDAFFNNLQPSLTQIAIVGGNPCFRLIRDDRYKISRQLVAFETALIAYKKFQSRNYNVFFCILIDHKVTHKTFLKDGCKNRKAPTLEDLKPSLQEIYRHTLDKYEVSPKDVYLIFEGQCVLRFQQWLKVPVNLGLKSELEKIEFRAFQNEACRPKNSPTTLSEEGKKQECTIFLEPINEAPIPPQLNCRCIFAYTFKKVNEYAQLQNKEGLIIGFWGNDDKRCDKTVIDGGIDIAKKYFKEVISPIRCFYRIPLGINDDAYINL